MSMYDAFQYFTKMAELVAEDSPPADQAIVARGSVRRCGNVTALDGIDLTVEPASGEHFGDALERVSSRRTAHTGAVAQKVKPVRRPSQP